MLTFHFGTLHPPNPFCQKVPVCHVYDYPTSAHPALHAAEVGDERGGGVTALRRAYMNACEPLSTSIGDKAALYEREVKEPT